MDSAELAPGSTDLEGGLAAEPGVPPPPQPQPAGSSSDAPYGADGDSEFAGLAPGSAEDADTDPISKLLDRSGINRVAVRAPHPPLSGQLLCPPSR